MICNVTIVNALWKNPFVCFFSSNFSSSSFFSPIAGADPPSSKTSNCNGTLLIAMLFSINVICRTIFLTFKQVAGYAVGGGHILHMVCDLTIAADNAIFGQTGPKVRKSFSFFNYDMY